MWIKLYFPLQTQSHKHKKMSYFKSSIEYFKTYFRRHHTVMRYVIITNIKRNCGKECYDTKL